MSNTTGVLTLKNNNNNISYEVPTSQNHSFKVNSAEYAKIDSGGLSIGTFNIPVGRLIPINTIAANPYTTTYELPSNALSIVYCCITQTYMAFGNYFAIYAVIGSSVGGPYYLYPIVTNNLTLGQNGNFFTIQTNAFGSNINGEVIFNVIKLV
jgi:hypothetical protein